MADSEEELRSLWMKVKEESEKASLKLSNKKTKIMACNCITLWQIKGGKLEAVTDVFFSSVQFSRSVVSDSFRPDEL